MLKLLKGLLETAEASCNSADTQAALPTQLGGILTRSGTIKRKRNRKVIDRLKMKFHKPVSEEAGELQSALKNSDGSKAGSTDISQKADVKFSLLRNRINKSTDELGGAEVNDYLEKAHELNDEIDTIPFAIELNDDPGKLIKIYVNATEADQFRDVLATKLGLEGNAEALINDLAATFDIVDVVWPDDEFEEDESDEDESTEEQSDSEETIDDDDDNSDSNSDDDAKIFKVKGVAEGRTLGYIDGVFSREEALIEARSRTTDKIRFMAEKQDFDFVDEVSIKLDTQYRALTLRVRRPVEKQLISFYALSGIPGRFLNVTDVLDKVEVAGDLLRAQPAAKKAFMSFLIGLATAKGFGVETETTEITESKHSGNLRGSFIQMRYEAVLVALGFPEELTTTAGPSFAAPMLSKTAKIIDEDPALSQLLTNLAIRLNIKIKPESVDDLIDDETDALVKEELNIGGDIYVNAIVDLVLALGIPEECLATKRSLLVSSLRTRGYKLRGSRSLVLNKIKLVAELLAKADELIGDKE